MVDPNDQVSVLFLTGRRQLSPELERVAAVDCGHKGLNVSCFRKFSRGFNEATPIDLECDR